MLLAFVKVEINSINSEQFSSKDYQKFKTWILGGLRTMNQRPGCGTKSQKKVRNIDSIFHRKYQKAGGQILQQTRGVRRMRRMVLWHGKPDDLCYKNEFSTLLSYYCRFLSWWQPMKPWILQLFPKIHSTPQLLHLPVLDSPTKF